MVDEKIEEPKDQNKDLEKKKDNTAVNLDEKLEVNLRELQIKLEKIKAYIVKTDGRVKRHELALQNLREKMLELENKRQSASVITRHKLKENI